MRHLMYPKSKLLKFQRASFVCCMLLMRRFRKTFVPVQLVELINTFVFLRFGLAYRCPIEQLHRLQPQPLDAGPAETAEPPIALDYLNSQILLNGLMESMTYLWPMLNASYFIQWFVSSLSIRSGRKRKATNGSGQMIQFLQGSNRNSVN